MRLYTRTGATALDDPEYGHFEASPDGGFDFPDDLSDRLHRFHVRGRPSWETDVERQHRLMAEEMERRRDPATLMDAVQKLVLAAQAVTPAEPPAPVKRASKRAAAASAGE
jgi:hypothetical protein